VYWRARIVSAELLLAAWFLPSEDFIKIKLFTVNVAIRSFENVCQHAACTTEHDGACSCRVMGEMPAKMWDMLVFGPSRLCCLLQ
jgi:hypothetical protein